MNELIQNREPDRPRRRWREQIPANLSWRRNRPNGRNHDVINAICTYMGRRVIGISGSLIWSKTLIELIFNPCGKFGWNPEGPSPKSTLLPSTLVPLGSFPIFKDLLICERESGVWKATGSYRTYLITGKTAALVPEFAVKDLPSAELQPRFLRLQWRTSHWAEHSEDDDFYLFHKIF